MIELCWFVLGLSIGAWVSCILEDKEDEGIKLISFKLFKAGLLSGKGLNVYKTKILVRKGNIICQM